MSEQPNALTRPPGWRARRKARRAATGAARIKSRTATLIPPEGAPLHFQVADLGARFAAQLADIALTWGAALVLTLFLNVIDILPGAYFTMFSSLLFFFIRVPYYIWAELTWNGRTIGKRLTGLRVVSADGRSLAPHAIVVRNLMKEAEVFSPALFLMTTPFQDALTATLIWTWLIVILAVPLLNRKRQRIGDLVANTYVIHQPAVMLAPDIARAPVASRYAFLPNQLDHYGKLELQTLEQILQVDEAGMNASGRDARRATLYEVARKVRAKISYPDPVRPDEAKAFLQAFYTAQRAYLESRKLFGDAREDKFHGTTKQETHEP